MDIEEIIKSKISELKKDMRLDVFLDCLLYDKKGYYNNNLIIGKNNDFITSPEINQMFGEIVGLYLYFIWKTNINSDFNLIELGPGTGTLFKDIFNSVSKFTPFIDKANITLVEINKKLIEIQKNNLKILNLQNLEWKKNFNLNTNTPSIIYSNEFFDCFPVRQFILREVWFEKFINFNRKEKRFYLKENKVNNKKLISYLDIYKKEKIYEVSFERNKYFEKICKHIKKNGGLFLTIDYGYIKNLYNFSLQAIYNHKYSSIFDNLGKQDISSHVNFTEFINIAKKNNLKIEEFSTQRDFLIKFGILERRNTLLNKNNKDEVNLDLNRLIGKKQMGELFKCLVVSNL